MKENLVRKSQRQSGLELLKIIAIFLIVVYHTIFTLRVANGYVPYNDY